MTQEELYQSFAEKLTALTGECFHVAKADLVPMVKKILDDKEAPSVSICETPFIKELGLVEGLKGAGIVVHTDHIRKNAETDKAGISEMSYGLADLGTVVQMRKDADDRIVPTLVDVHISLLRRSTILESLDTMIDKLCEMPEIPDFVGFITGPSRTADIECVGTVGVHGPRQAMTIVIDDV